MKGQSHTLFFFWRSYSFFRELGLLVFRRCPFQTMRVHCRNTKCKMFNRLNSQIHNITCINLALEAHSCIFQICYLLLGVSCTGHFWDVPLQVWVWHRWHADLSSTWPCLETVACWWCHSEWYLSSDCGYRQYALVSALHQDSGSRFILQYFPFFKCLSELFRYTNVHMTSSICFHACLYLYLGLDVYLRSLMDRVPLKSLRISSSTHDQ